MFSPRRRRLKSRGALRTEKERKEGNSIKMERREAIVFRALQEMKYNTANKPPMQALLEFESVR